MITSPHDNKSWEALDEMIGNAEEFCKMLGVSYRVVCICSGTNCIKLGLRGKMILSKEASIYDVHTEGGSENTPICGKTVHKIRTNGGIKKPPKISGRHIWKPPKIKGLMEVLFS